MQVNFDKCSDALDCAIKDKSFGVFHSTVNAPNLNIHTHECCEVFLCLSGGNNFLINDKVYDVNDGDLFFMNQFEPHKIVFLPDAPVERYVLQLHPEFIFKFSTPETDLSKCFYSKNIEKCNKITLEYENVAYFKEMFEKLDKSYEFADDVIKQSVVVQILAKLNTLAIHTNMSDEYRVQNQPLKLAMDFINSNFQENISLDMVAKSAYISVNQLCKLFKTNLGTTVTKYIVGKRISEAKKCLKRGHNVSDTAMMCGFADYSNFIRTFSACVGISPGKYGKESKNDLA